MEIAGSIRSQALQLNPKDGLAKTGAAAVLSDGRKDANSRRGTPAQTSPAEDAQLLAAASLPNNYYQSGAAQARREVFVRRGHLTRELTALGLPPVYEHPTGVLVGKQVETRPEGPAPSGGSGGWQRQEQHRQQQRVQKPEGTEPAWQRIRTRALNPAHNPVMARNIRMKAQLAAYAARGAAAAAARSQPSGRLMRHLSAQDEAARTIAKLMVVSGAEQRRMGSAPLSKPYYPRRRRGGVPANETEGGDLMPGRLARRAAEQVAEEEERAAAEAHRGPSAAERRRQAQIEELADVIVAAPQVGVHELGVYLPHELVAGGEAEEGSAAPSLDKGSYDQLTPTQRRRRRRHPQQMPEGQPRQSSTRHRQSSETRGPIRGLGTGHNEGDLGKAVTAGGDVTELSEALRELEMCAAAGRAAVAAAEGDYGSHMITRGGAGGGAAARAVAIPVLSPVASSYGSGGHYLYEEGMAEDDDGDSYGRSYGSSVSNDDDAARETDPNAVPASASKAPGVGVSALEAETTARSRYPEQVTVETSPGADVVVTRYPAGGAVVRQRAQARSQHDGGLRAAAERVQQQVRGSQTTAAAAFDLEAMRRPDAQPGNEMAGGRWRGAPVAATSAAEAERTNLNVSAEATDTSVAEGEGATTAQAPQQSLEASSAATTAPELPAAAANTFATARSAAAMLRLANEVSYPGRVRYLQQPEIAGKDLSGVWAEAAITAARPSAGRVSSRTPHADSASAVPPPWRRESHAERTEALLAAAAAANPDADVDVSTQAEAGTEAAREGPRGPDGGAGEGSRAQGRQRIVARGGRMEAPPVVMARRVGGTDAGTDVRAAGPSTWGGVQVGRTVAVAVAVPAVAAVAQPESAGVVAAAAGTAVTLTAAPATEVTVRRDVEAAPDAVPAASPSEALERGSAPAAAALSAPFVAESTSQRADRGPFVGGPRGLTSTTGHRHGGGEEDGPSLDRFGMLSDADSDAAAESEGSEEEGKSQQHGAGQLHEGHDDNAAPRQGRGQGRGSERGDPWDSSSDEDNPWGIADADEMGYPRASRGQVSSKAASSRDGRGSAAATLRTAPLAGGGALGRAAEQTSVYPPLDLSPDTGTAAAQAVFSPSQEPRRVSIGGSSSAGSWGIREGPAGGAKAAAVRPDNTVRWPPGTVAVAGALRAVQVHQQAMSGRAAVPSSGSLRQVFGLAAASQERVVDPREVPPLQLTPPPEWLVGPHEPAGFEFIGQVAERDSAGAGDEKRRAQHPQTMGRVEAALLHAESRTLPLVVRHDSRTFFFSEHPIIPTST